MVIVYKCHRWFWSSLACSFSNITGKQLSSRFCVPAPQGQGLHRLLHSHSYVKLKTVSYTFKRIKRAGGGGGWLTLWIQPARFPLSPSPDTFLTNIWVHFVVLQLNLSGGATAKRNPLGKNTFTCRAEGAFTGRSVRGNAFPFTQLVSVESFKSMDQGQCPGSTWKYLGVPGSLCLSAQPPAGRRVTQGKRGKGVSSHSSLCSHSITNTGNKLPTTKLTGIWPKTRQYRSAWLGSQNSTFPKIKNLQSLKPFSFNRRYLQNDTHHPRKTWRPESGDGGGQGVDGAFPSVPWCTPSNTSSSLPRLMNNPPKSLCTLWSGSSLTLQSVHLLNGFYAHRCYGRQGDEGMQKPAESFHTKLKALFVALSVTSGFGGTWTALSSLNANPGTAFQDFLFLKEPPIRKLLIPQTWFSTREQRIFSEFKKWS